MTVSGLAGPLSDLDFRFSATSSSISGMSIELFSPNFTRSAVWDAPLGSGAHFQDTYLDDEAGGERLGQPGSNTAPFASSDGVGAHTGHQQTFRCSTESILTAYGFSWFISSADLKWSLTSIELAGAQHGDLLWELS